MSFTRLLARPLAWAAFTASFLFLLSVTVLAQTTILNVSYDVSRELYKDINPAFIADWKAKTGEAIVVNGQTLTIVGVAPRGFGSTTIDTRASVFVPITMRGVLQSGTAASLAARRSDWRISPAWRSS